MKKTLLIFSVLILIVLGGIVFQLTRNAEVAPSPEPLPSNPFPQENENELDSSPVPNQIEANGTQPEIAYDFKQQIQNADLITVRGTIVVGSYALQTWGDENKGGEALLVYRGEREGWVLLSMGGGAWGVQSLVEEGVPLSTAEALIAGRNK
jgi:hypothetical protein